MWKRPSFLLFVAGGVAVFGLIAAVVILTSDQQDQTQHLAAEDWGQHRTINGRIFADQGEQSVTGEEIQRLDADRYSFSPTFLRGEPGQRLTLAVENQNTTIEHNFTLVEQGIIQNIPPGEAIEVAVVFPESGTLVFFCSFHTSWGMTGMLVAGDAQIPAGD